MHDSSAPVTVFPGKPIDVRKTRRRIEDALRKTATKEEILYIARLLRIRVEPLCSGQCSRCGETDYVAGDDYPEGITKVGGEMLCRECRALDRRVQGGQS